MHQIEVHHLIAFVRLFGLVDGRASGFDTGDRSGFSLVFRERKSDESEYEECDDFLHKSFLKTGWEPCPMDSNI